MPAGGIVPNNLHRKQSGASSSQASSSKAASKADAKNSGGGSHAAGSSSSATAAPSSVQQSSPSSRRRVIITAPLSPPTTRASRSKETESSKAEQRKSSDPVPSSSKKSKSSKQANVKGKAASPQPASVSKQKKANVPQAGTSTKSSKEEAKVPHTSETREKRRKSKKKKAKRSKSKKHDRHERAPPPPSPPISVDFATPRRGSSRRKSKSEEALQSEPEERETETVVTKEKDKRPSQVEFGDDLDNRRPTLTLVTPQSPMKEENSPAPVSPKSPKVEEQDDYGSITSQLLSSSRMVLDDIESEHQSSFLESAVDDMDQDDSRVECILPHGINEVDEADLMDTLASTSAYSSRENEHEDMLEIFATQSTSPHLPDEIPDSETFSDVEKADEDEVKIYADELTEKSEIDIAEDQNKKSPVVSAEAEDTNDKPDTHEESALVDVSDDEAILEKDKIEEEEADTQLVDFKDSDSLPETSTCMENDTKIDTLETMEGELDNEIKVDDISSLAASPTVPEINDNPDDEEDGELADEESFEKEDVAEEIKNSNEEISVKIDDVNDADKLINNSTVEHNIIQDDDDSETTKQHIEDTDCADDDDNNDDVDDKDVMSPVTSPVTISHTNTNDTPDNEHDDEEEEEEEEEQEEQEEEQESEKFDVPKEEASLEKDKKSEETEAPSDDLKDSDSMSGTHAENVEALESMEPEADSETKADDVTSPPTSAAVPDTNDTSDDDDEDEHEEGELVDNEEDSPEDDDDQVQKDTIVEETYKHAGDSTDSNSSSDRPANLEDDAKVHASEAMETEAETEADGVESPPMSPPVVPNSNIGSEEPEEGELVDVSDDEAILEKSEVEVGKEEIETATKDQEDDENMVEQVAPVEQVEERVTKSPILEMGQDEDEPDESMDEDMTEQGVIVEEEVSEPPTKVALAEDEEDDEDEDRLYVDESYDSPVVEEQLKVSSESNDDISKTGEETKLQQSTTAVQPETDSHVLKPDDDDEMEEEVDDDDDDDDDDDAPTRSESPPVPELTQSSASPPQQPKLASPEPTVALESAPVTTSSPSEEKPETSLPPEISDFVLSVLDHKSDESLGKMDDLESISSESLASPQSDVENSIKMCIQTLESDEEDDSTQSDVAPCREQSPSPPTSARSPPSAAPMACSTIASTTPSVHVLSMSVPKIPSLTSNSNVPGLTQQNTTISTMQVPTTIPSQTIPISKTTSSSSASPSLVVPIPTTTTILTFSTSTPTPSTHVFSISIPKVPIVSTPVSSSLSVPVTITTSTTVRVSPALTTTVSKEIRCNPVESTTLTAPPAPVSSRNEHSARTSPVASENLCASDLSSSPLNTLATLSTQILSCQTPPSPHPGVTSVSPSAQLLSSRTSPSPHAVTVGVPQRRSSLTSSSSPPSASLATSMPQSLQLPSSRTATPPVDVQVPPPRLPSQATSSAAPRETPVPQSTQLTTLPPQTTQSSSVDVSEPKHEVPTDAVTSLPEIPAKLAGPTLVLASSAAKSEASRYSPVEVKVSSSPELKLAGPTLVLANSVSSKDTIVQTIVRTDQKPIESVAPSLPSYAKKPSLVVSTKHTSYSPTQGITTELPPVNVFIKNASGEYKYETSSFSTLETPSEKVKLPMFVPKELDVSKASSSPTPMMPIMSYHKEDPLPAAPSQYITSQIARLADIVPPPVVTVVNQAVSSVPDVSSVRTAAQRKEGSHKPRKDKSKSKHSSSKHGSSSRSDSSRKSPKPSHHTPSICISSGPPIPSPANLQQPLSNGLPPHSVASTLSSQLSLASTSCKELVPTTGTSIVTQSEVVVDAGIKRSREEYLEAVPTRVQFMLPQSVPPVSTVADAPSQSLSVATTSQPTTTPVAYDPSLLYFVQPDGQQAFEGNYQLVYAAAAATTERDEGVMDGPPNKVRLLYAEALGVGSDSQNGNELQFYYAAATPGQHVEHTSTPCHVQLMEPCRVNYSQGSNEARSEMLQYQVQPMEQQQQEQDSRNQQQQVLNLSVNHNPVYYYNYTSTATLSHQPPLPPPPPQPGQQDQQQQQHSNYEHNQYSSTSTAKLVVAHQNSYSPIETNQHSQRDYSHYNDVGGEVQDLSSRRLELPVHTARSNQIAYAHVRSNDPVQYNFLEKAREVQHVFPQGALRHCDNSYAGLTSVMSNQNIPNGYPNNGVLPVTNGGVSSSVSSSKGASDVDSSVKMTGLDLLSAATEKIKAMQYEALCTERAAAAIAAVGELARMKRMEHLEQHNMHRQRTPQQPAPLRQEAPRALMHTSSSFTHMLPPQAKMDSVSATSQDSLPPHFQNVLANQRPPQLYPQQNMQLFQAQQTVPPATHEMTMGTNPQNQQAGIKRGPRKYYLSRSAQFQD